jgi:hypothetical protein
MRVKKKELERKKVRTWELSSFSPSRSDQRKEHLLCMKHVSRGLKLFNVSRLVQDGYLQLKMLDLSQCRAEVTCPMSFNYIFFFHFYGISFMFLVSLILAM